MDWSDSLKDAPQRRSSAIGRRRSESREFTPEVTSLVFARSCLRSSEAAGSRACIWRRHGCRHLKLVRDDSRLTDSHATFAHKRRLDLSGNMGEADCCLSVRIGAVQRRVGIGPPVPVAIGTFVHPLSDKADVGSPGRGDVVARLSISASGISRLCCWERYPSHSSPSPQASLEPFGAHRRKGPIGSEYPHGCRS
jgi:hypothetical protein